MSLARRIQQIVDEHSQQQVYDEAARALEQADTHPFAVAREDVAWVGAALAIALGVVKAPRVHRVELRDEVGVADGV